jgi:cyclophilin family peptidyl-prolyl cis-trans isomerase
VEPDKYLVIETPKGRIVARLHTTPGTNVLRTVANVSERINSGALDGSTFFRVEDWLVQGGGDPDATSRLPAEYNKIPFTAGSVALAHGVDPAFNSDSQFLIAKTDAPQLNDQYTNLGQVIEGMDVVNKIIAGDKMTKVRVVTNIQ